MWMSEKGEKSVSCLRLVDPGNEGLHVCDYTVVRVIVVCRLLCTEPL